jgi:uncharacterized membrane protein
MIRAGRTLLAAGMLLLPAAFPVRVQEPTVRAVLFYSPGCGACKTVINEILPPLILKYGFSLTIFDVDVTKTEGGDLYQAALDELSVPADHRAVPLLMVDHAYLVGANDIRDRFPGLIDAELAQGGTNWPVIPGLDSALQKAGFTSVPATSWDRFRADQPANSLAVAVLAFLFLSLVFSILITFRPAPEFMDSIPEWVFPLLLVIGLLVASYLTYTESTHSEVFCGGISHCTAVQDSSYSKILGLISVGEFGVIGYCFLGLALLVERVTRGKVRTIASIAKFGFAVFGVSFSMYLTFLEPFVIGATCLWCLTSAVIMGLVLPLTTGAVRDFIQPHPQTSGGAAG